VPLGEGWWIASDGKWYPANAHPDAPTQQSPVSESDLPPAEGWWKASDGNWYAPELHPDNIAAITLSRPPTRTAVTRASRTSTVLGGNPVAEPGAVAAGVGSRKGHTRVTHGPDVGERGLGNGVARLNGSGGAERGNRPSAKPTYSPDLAAVNGHGRAAARSRNDVGDRREAEPDRRGGVERRSGGDRRGGAADRRSDRADRRSGAAEQRDGEPTGSNLPSGLVPRASVSGNAGGPGPAGHAASGGQNEGPANGDLGFDPLNDPATLFGDWQPPPARPAASGPTEGPTRPTRPTRPGFGKTDEPPSGSTIHEQLPSNQYRPQVAPGQVPRADGFDEWLDSFASMPVPRTTKVTPPPQRLTGVSDVLHGARGTMGGPASATPRISSSEADFFVLKPAGRKPKPAPAQPRSRTKLSAAIFFLVLFLVLAAVAIAFFYFHAHGIGPHVG
jgi:hypothetical protein